MHIVFQTRFSFLGKPGWKSAAVADPERLFDAERLDARFRLFETVTLPGLAGQTDPDFTHMVMSSTRMPDADKRLLREMVHDTLGASRARVMFRPEGSAGGYFRNAMAKTHGAAPCAQVVLDDDDAVTADFTEVVRSQAEAALAVPHREANYLFLSFARGYTMILEDGRLPSLRRRFAPYAGPGLTLVGPGDVRRNPVAASHRRAGLRHPSLLVTGSRPFYLRTVHGRAESSAAGADQHLTAEDMAGLFGHFPFLTRIFVPDALRLAA